ncbi:MAG: hypothetical protein ACOX5R_08500 [bacterium]|jgi:hypothetical protein
MVSEKQGIMPEIVTSCESGSQEGEIVLTEDLLTLQSIPDGVYVLSGIYIS